ncbi:MAG: DNA polymerase ligase N-terminal domain-containing protein [Bacilli bacterium]|nr:DNA polymerase ligase N-terminal domain-containing protein [Bacilli bacterium]
MNKLNIYNKKRDFSKTKEPKGNIDKKKGKLSFVVQHHLARNDHYDLRLELDGTLKSWAVPKGPSYNPQDKRLAILVEDHPISYRSFEGTIPKGEYGGGTVMVWDKGTWSSDGAAKDSLKKGMLKFTLKGKKLTGDWALVHMKEDNWLLIKEKDQFSTDKIDISKYDVSVKTGRTMDEIARNVKK